MNWKMIWVACALIMLFPYVGMSVRFVEPVGATQTWIVDDNGPADFLTIQEAINAASDGDTIYVKSGTYRENLVVNKSVSLVGENRHDTVIWGHFDVVRFTASNISMAYFTVYGQSAHYHTSCILVENSSGNSISYNILKGDDVGIDLLSSNSNIITGNTVLFNLLIGISLRRSSNNTIVNNTSSGFHDAAGIFIEDNSSHNVVVGNRLSFRREGLRLRASSNNWIAGNTVFKNTHGIFLQENCDNNTIVENEVANNTYGIEIDVGFQSDNSIYHNDFSGNALHVQVASGYVNMDKGYPLGGNFWSDHSPPDVYGGPYQNETGSDGIGDTPYIIDENNQDKYPLNGIFSDFNVTSEYHVQTICNSTISDFQFNGTAISFSVSGEDGTIGFCRISIPTALIPNETDTYQVFVNGTEVSYTLLPFSNSTHSFLYFTYEHSTQEVILIPEFPSALILPLLIIFTLIVVLSKKKRLYGNKHQQQFTLIVNKKNLY